MGRIGVCGTRGGATGAAFGVESGSVAPWLVPQVPLFGGYWGLWHQGWCHRAGFGGRIGVCGTMVGATGVGLSE